MPETPRVLDNQVGLVPVVHGLHVMAVEVAQEHAIVAGVVLGPLTRGVQNFRARRYSSVMDRVDGMAVGSAEGQVKFRVSVPMAGLSQKLGMLSEPDRPTTKALPCGKRIISRIPIGANVRRQKASDG